LAGFFFLFFGLSLTDVGYGLFLMVVALVVLFYFKVPPIIKLFGKLLFLMGLSSALVGLLFGGYLGIEASKLPAWLQAIQVFDPIGNPLPVFYLALALGVVQVMFGMVLKIYSDARNKMLMTGILDQGPWLLLFTSLIFYGASVLGYVNFVTSDDVLILVYLALVTVVVSSGRTGKTVLGKIQMSLLSLYNSIGYFSDILSYSRLLALGLATSALAFAVNLIAEIVSEMIPYVGFILAIIILIVGHLFTLVVNTLGAFIHSARLQFVEFFGKFITGTGQNFKPLTRKETYINIVKDSS
jgi:V/A-type H+-transporting ATPase subunit I